MKQNEAVIQTLERLGGVATLGQLNQETFKTKECIWKTKTPFASIRRIVQVDKNIYKIKPGLYGLKKLRTEIESRGIIAETATNKNSVEMAEFNHSYYQGLLLIVGNLKGMRTFVPNQDRNKRFITKPLGEIRTLESLPQFSFPNIVQTSSSIDAIWFNDRFLPHSLFEVEHSTNIERSLTKFNELQDFYCRMVIVADVVRKGEFENKVRYSSYRDVRDRVKFLSYDILSRQYENLVQTQHDEFVL